MAKKKVFLSFDYKRDSRRVQQVKNIGAIERQPILDANDWEKIEGQGDAAIERWIKKQMADKHCLVVLIGSQTAGRRWVEYEIKKAWGDGMGVVGIYIHNLNDPVTGTAVKGKNPFDRFDFGSNNKFSEVVKAYDPPSTNAYAWIQDHIENAVNEAIQIRKKYT